MAANMKKKISLVVKTLFDKNDELGKNRKSIVIEQFLAGTTNTLVNNNYFTGLLILLKLNDTTIGNISVLNSLGGVFQALSVLFLGKYKRKKNILYRQDKSFTLRVSYCYAYFCGLWRSWELVL